MSFAASITNGPRTLRPDGGKYDKYFPKATGKILSRAKRGDVADTVKRMQAVIWETLPQTAVIAKVLKAETVEKYGANHSKDDLLRHVWEFWFYNVQYKLDAKDAEGNELEQLRQPARTWADRLTGVDCDCFVISITSTLLNLRVADPQIRTAQYLIWNEELQRMVPTWRHVYNRVGNRIIDAVLAPFGYEEPYYHVKDYSVMEVQVLGNVPAFRTTAYPDPTIAALEPIRREIETQVDNARRNPALFSTAYPAADFIRYAEYALAHWHNPADRDIALRVLADREQSSNQMAGFGATGKPIKKFFSTVKNTVQNTVQTAKTVVQTAKGDDGKLSFKEGLKLVAQQSPATVLIREGVKLAFHTNLFQMAEKLAPAYTASATPAQKKARTEIEAKWLKLGGLAVNLQEAIMTGKGAKKAGLRGFGALGEPITAATLLASMPVIMEVLKTLKENGLISKVPTEAEVKAAASADGSVPQNAADKSPAKAPEKKGIGNFINNVINTIAPKGTSQQNQQPGDVATETFDPVTPPNAFDKSGTTSTDYTPYIIGGVVLLGIAGAVYAYRKDQAQLSTMTSSDRKEVLKARTTAAAAAAVAQAAFNGAPKKRAAKATANKAKAQKAKPRKSATASNKQAATRHQAAPTPFTLILR